MLNLNAPEIKFALNAVHQASLLISEVQANLAQPALTKGDQSPVTVADFASQALVGHLLAGGFPGDPMVGEEDSTALRESSAAETLELVNHFVKKFIPQANTQDVCEWIDHQRVDTADRFWTLDPIDGTKGFLRGDQYAVALALVIDGKVNIGVLGCPKLSLHPKKNSHPGCLIVAERGKGAWGSALANQYHFERLQASEVTQPSQARILRSFESGHTNINQTDLFAQSLGVAVPPTRMDSQAKYALLAAGEGEIMLRLLSPSKPDYKEKIWDQAAGSIILEEAGGQISDLDGKPLDFTTGRTLSNNRGVLASNAFLHPLALQTLHTLQV